MQYVYPCSLVPDYEEGKGFVVAFTDVPEAITGAKSAAESLILAEDALIAALSMYVQCGEDIPIPSPAADGQRLVALPPIPAAKLALYIAMREQGISEAALGERLGIDVDAVRKLINPDRYTHITRIMEALRVVGRSLIIEDVDIDDGSAAAQTEREAESEPKRNAKREPERAAAV